MGCSSWWRRTARQRRRITADSVFWIRAQVERTNASPDYSQLVANFACLPQAWIPASSMDVHAQQSARFFDIPVDHLDSLPVLIKFCKRAYRQTTVCFSRFRRAQNGFKPTPNTSANLAIVAKERRSATGPKPYISSVGRARRAAGR